MKNALALVTHPSNLRIDGAFLDDVCKSRARSGEERLTLALLQDAIHSFFKYLRATDGKEKEILAETEGWIFEKNSDWIFSFENVCETLGISASYLRAELRRRGELESKRGEPQKYMRHANRAHRAPPQHTVYACEERLAAAAGG